MEHLFGIALILLLVTYFEGAFFALFISQLKKTSFVRQFITVILWPITIPLMFFTFYKIYAPIIKEMQTNPMLQALMGINQTNLMQNAIENNEQKEIDTPL